MYIGGIASVSYYFRHSLKRLLIRCVLYSLSYVITVYTKFYNEEYNFKKTEEKKLDDYHLHKYNLILNNKQHTISFMSECDIELSKDVTKLKNNLKEKLLNKHFIVHCSITDYEDNIFIDLTDVFRHFFYYFDIKCNENDRIPRLKAFLRYVEDVYGTLLDPNVYRLTLYMNDDNFTEYHYPLKDILDKTFSDLFIPSCQVN
jgi:hypothetical protein